MAKTYSLTNLTVNQAQWLIGAAIFVQAIKNQDEETVQMEIKAMSFFERRMSAEEWDGVRVALSKLNDECDEDLAGLKTSEVMKSA